jgi:hypothetical protein
MDNDEPYLSFGSDMPPSAQPQAQGTPKSRHESPSISQLSEKSQQSVSSPVKRKAEELEIPQTVKRTKVSAQLPSFQSTVGAVAEASKQNEPPQIRYQKNGAALPSKLIFDPWNLNSKGHQTAKNLLSGTAGWRESRELKLAQQFAGGRGGGKRMQDLVGRGAADGGKIGPKGDWTQNLPKDSKQKSITDCFANTAKPVSQPLRKPLMFSNATPYIIEPLKPTVKQDSSPQILDEDPLTVTTTRKSSILAGCTFYINGSTVPLISDHALRHIIVQNGGAMSSALLRKRVTHVILSTHTLVSATSRDAPPSTLTAELAGLERENALKRIAPGGGLSASKLQKEAKRNATGRGQRIWHVGAQWVLDCIKQGRRLGEGTYAEWDIAGNGQGTMKNYVKPGKKGNVKDEQA